MHAAQAPADRSAPPPQRDDALPRGTRLEGGVVDSVLAESGFSIVYRVRGSDGKSQFAVKEYLPVALAARGGDGFSVAPRSEGHAAGFAAGLAAFEREAALLARCQHPSLLAVRGVWRAHGTAYRAMPLLAGSTLQALRATMADSAPDEAAVRQLLDGLGGALQALHAAGQAHGDVVPGNIIVRADDGRPVLLDTGAVRRAVLGDDTRALMALLEPAYASGAAVPAADAQHADLRALAAVAVFWITGRMPVSAGAGQPPSLAATVRALPARASHPQYSAALLAAIDGVLAGGSASAARSIDDFRQALAGHRTPLPVQVVRQWSLGGHGLKRAEPPALPAALPPLPPAAKAPSAPRAAPPASPAASSAAPAAPPVVPRRPWVEPPRQSPQRVSAQRGRWFAVVFVALVLVGGGWVFKEQRAAFLDGRARAAAAATRDLAAAAAREIAMAPPSAGIPAPAAANPPPPARSGSAARNSIPAGRVAKAGEGTAGGVAALPASPRAACGNRTPFSLYRCMQAECRKPQWAQHSQCIKMSRTDSLE